jgi:PIN domain nuclease of toxin-antitoxin system
MILADTNIAIWVALDPHRLSTRARTAIDNARAKGQGVAICDITFLEVATLVHKARIRLNASLESLLSEMEARFVVLPITAEACVRALALPNAYPKDPADRIIGATALVNGLPLVTADDAIRRSKAFATIW